MNAITSRLNTRIAQLKGFKRYFAAAFFFGGFAWDALTIGRSVGTFDLIAFAFYITAAASILYGMSRYYAAETDTLPRWLQQFLATHWPYFILQFLFGSLLSALFILYLKSASHFLAWGMALGLGGLLVANEYLEDDYRNFTLSWALFGFCTILLFNFALPVLLGSISAIWFYASTVLGAGLVVWLYRKSPSHLGSIIPVWLIAIVLMLAYRFDVIPPVPLVKRDVAIALNVQHVGNHYQLQQQAAPWWQFWRAASNDLTIVAGQRVYCFSAVFAPQGLSTRLYHRWQHYNKKTGWQDASRIGFNVNGGRDGGFRGYTYKQNLSAGDWRVNVETENGKTITVHDFTLTLAAQNTPLLTVQY